MFMITGGAPVRPGTAPEHRESLNGRQLGSGQTLTSVSPGRGTCATRRGRTAAQGLARAAWCLGRR
jgi:hypothetical protein